MADQYEFWRKALKGPIPDMTEEPESGFYAMRRGSPQGPRVAVAIWKDDAGTHMVATDKKPVSENAWTWMAKNPIPEAHYRAVEAGKPWPNEAVKPDIDPFYLPNDPAEAMKAEIEIERATVDAFLAEPITDDDRAGQAADMVTRMRELTKRAEEKRVELKKPHDDAGKAVQTVWQPLVDGAKGLTDMLLRAQTAFLTEKKRKAHEEERIAREEARKAAEAAAAAGAPPPVPVAVPEAAPVRAKGGTGRTVSLRTVARAEVEDWAAAAVALVEVPEVREAIQKIADRQARAGVTTPGCKRIEEQKAA